MNVKLADTIKSQAKATKERINKLTQAIVVKAFCGEMLKWSKEE